MKKKVIVEKLFMIFWIFLIGSLLGYIFEMTIVLFQKGYFESRQGLIYGPFTPVYGIGAIIYYLILSNVKTRNKVKVFIISALLGGTTEYICSFIQEKLFGTISWDYSYLTFNLNGRTSLLHSTYWGIAGVLYITFVEGLLDKLKQNITHKRLQVITAVLSVFIIFDITISYVAAVRQTQRDRAIEASSKLDLFLDEYYPEEYRDKIFANKKKAGGI